jgi:hypothetical protein
MKSSKLMLLLLSSILIIQSIAGSVRASPVSYFCSYQNEAISALTLQSCPGETIEGELKVTASGENTEDCRINLSWEAEWLNLSPTEFVLAPGASRMVAMRVNTIGMKPGNYSCNIVLRSNCKPAYSEIPVMLEVLSAVMRIDQPKADWELPFEGTVRKEIGLTNSFCKSLVEISVDARVDSTVEIMMDLRPFTMGAREHKTIPITFRTREFKPKKEQSIKIIFSSDSASPVIAEYRLIPEEEIPLLEVHEIPEALEEWKQQRIILRGFLHRGSNALATSDPFVLLSMDAMMDYPYVLIRDPEGFLQWNPWEQAPVVYADLKGTLHAGRRGQPAELLLEESPKTYYPVLYPYPRLPEEALPSRRPARGSADYLVIIGSTFHPIPEWMDRDLILKWEAGMFFNSSEKHMKIFYGEGILPIRNLDPRSIADRKTQMKPYLAKAYFSEISKYFKELETTMRTQLRAGQTPSLTLLIGGYSEKIGEEMTFFLRPGEALSVETLAQELEKISILGPVRIELNTSYARTWTERLLQIGNVKIITSSQADEKSYVHEQDLETQLSRLLKSGKAGNSLGQVEWLELLEQISNPFGGKGTEWSEIVKCQFLDYRKSHLKEAYVWSRYKISHIQHFLGPQQHEYTDSEYHYEINCWLPVNMVDPVPEPQECPRPPRPPWIIITTTAGNDPPIVDIEGEVHRLNPERESFDLYDPFFDVFKEVVFPERPLPVNTGDRVRIRGTEQGEDKVIPITIEVLEKSCGFTVLGPEDLVLCPSCLSKDYSTGYGMDYQDLKWILSNVGEIGIGVSWNMEIEALTENPGIQLQLVFPEETPNPVDLAPGQSYDLEGLLNISMVPEVVEEEVRFRISAHFGIAPAPPCIAYESWSFEIIFCPNKRNINGKATFKNVNDVECPLKDLTLRMYLRFDPQCGHDTTLRELIGNIPDLHESANEGLPAFKYYLETRTNKDGEYSFSFIDKDCDHRYRIMAIFESSEIEMNYHDCSKRFYAYGDISGQKQPCKETDYERNLRIGIEGDLKFPSNFTGDPRAVAQSWCHMQECFDVFRGEKCNGNNMIRAGYLPVNVCIYSHEAGTWYDPNGRLINIEQADSAINSPNRPMNREWHEFGHFLHDALMGLPPITAGDENHGGFSNSNSSDSLVEGIAEVISTLILRKIKQASSCCDQYGAYRNGIYLMDAGSVDLENDPDLHARAGEYGYYNSEGNWVRVSLSDLRLNTGGQLVDTAGRVLRLWNPLEEFAVAGVLLDLIDDAGWYDEDRDGFSFVRWQDLFCLIKDHNISTMKELYDRLHAMYGILPNTMNKLNDIFTRRGFFEDRNFNGRRDPSEAIGSTFRPAIRYRRDNPSPPPARIWVNGPRIDSRPDFPIIAGSGIKIQLLDANEHPLPFAFLTIEVLSGKGEVFFSYTLKVYHDEILPLFLPPYSGGRIRLSLKNNTGTAHMIEEESLWKSVAQEQEHAGVYTFLVGGTPETGSWQWDSDSIKKLQVVQGQSTSFPLLYWYTGTKIDTMRLKSSESWLSPRTQEVSDPAGRILWDVHASQVQPGIYKVKLFMEGPEGIEKTSEIEVEVLPSTMVIQLWIANKKALVEGRELLLDAAPYIRPPGRTMVPLRFISEGFGALIDYAPKQGLVTDIWVLFQSTELHLKIGSPESWNNGQKVSMDAPAEIVAGRTFVPIRFISESFGAIVSWEAKTQSIELRLKR